MENGNGFLIMLADDDLDDREIFGEVVGAHVSDITFRAFGDGEELLRYLLEPESRLPDLLFLDFHMPLKSGLQILEEIKGHDRLRHISTVIYSGSDRPVDIKRSYDLLADLYIKK